MLPVHLYGEPADLEPILRLARHHGLRVIEDCAQSHGALYRGRPTGSIGDIACFSFYPTKNLGALGDAGITATDDASLATALREVREYGWRERYVSARAGINTRLDPIQAAILGAKLPHLAADNARRQAIAARYDAGSRRSATGHAGPPRRCHPCLPPIRDPCPRGRPRPLREHLRRAQSAPACITRPVHLQPAYAGRLGEYPAGLPETTRAMREILSLPMYPQLGDGAADRVVREIRRFFE